MLSPSEIQSLTAKHTGPAVDLGQVREALGALLNAYRSRGYVTVGVTLPPQQLTNGVVRVVATEGRLADIQISGNRHFSDANIRRALPSLATNVLLNTRWFQAELDRANGNVDRQIYPVIGPGPEPGTSALTLNVKDRNPLHGRFEVNNRATPGTPALRIDSAIQYNNLFQREHQAGFQYNFTPQETKDSDVPLERFLEFPRVASYSAFYRVPLGYGSGALDQFEQAPSSFGYDAVTRTFRAPALTGNRDLLIYASRSSSETRLREGPRTVITNTALADISSQFVAQDLTFNENVGLRLTWPLQEFSGIRSSLFAGLDYKTYQGTSSSTNITFFDLYALDEFGNRVLVRSETIPLEANSRNSLFYVPLTWGWSASRSDRQGFTALTLSQTLYLDVLSSDDERFRRLAGSTDAGGNYTSLRLNLFREQRFSGDWSISLRAAGQWSSAPLISNEQFSLGGTDGVRGYEEGEEFGDAGWKVQLEPRLPALALGQIDQQKGAIPITLRGSVFADYGERYLLDAPSVRRDTERMLGVGFGGLVNFGQSLEARLSLAWALLDTATSEAGTARATFSVGVQF